VRRSTLGVPFLLLSIAYAWVGTRAADPGGAAMLVVPGNSSESVRWLVTQLWGLAMTGWGVAGAALILGRAGTMVTKIIAVVAALTSVLVARCFDGAGGWTTLAAVGAMCALAACVPAVKVAHSSAP
jgi:hypothetical protein